MDVDPDDYYSQVRRSDLIDTVSLVFPYPAAGTDAAGRSWIGLNAVGGQLPADIEDIVQATLKGIVEESLANAGDEVFPQLQPNEVSSHRYESGPAAQSWPTDLFVLWNDVRPLLEDTVLLASAAQLLISIRRRVSQWLINENQRTLQEAQVTEEERAAINNIPEDIMVHPQANLVTLCLYDAVERHGLTGDGSVHIHSRISTPYSTPDHPCLADDYLIRILQEERQIFYQVDGHGVCREHFYLVGNELMQQGLPDFDGGDLQFVGAPSFPASRGSPSPTPYKQRRYTFSL
jgi:hypothetical protein